MVHRHYNFPSLNGLAAFEAAGRHLSLTRAAGEMNVTPGALSKHIKLLEAEIDTKLFLRLHRALELTAEGSALLEALRSSFSHIADVLAGFRKGGAKRVVSIGTTNAFAQLWLMPRLGRFWNAHQDIIVDHIISDRTQESPISPLDLRVRYGTGQFRDEMAVKLFDDRIMAVASPAFLQGRNDMTLPSIAGQTLLSVEGADWTWTTWAEFLRDGGVKFRRLDVRRFNSHVIALQAALDGQGIVLGWKSLVAPLVEGGQLVMVGGHEMLAPQSFYLTWSVRRSLSAEAEALKEWLLAQVA